MSAQTQNFKLVEAYRGYVIVQKTGETLLRVFAENDALFQDEIGGYSKIENAKRKIESLTENMADARPTAGGSAPQDTAPQHDKAKALSIEKIREKCQDIEALFIARDQAQTTLRDLTLMRNENKETKLIICTFTQPDTGKKVTFALHAQELLEKGIAIAERSLDAVEFSITNRERRTA